jgi:hypothetical protein
MEYEFIVIYKPRCTHVIADALSRLLDTTKSIGVSNQTINAALFMLQPIWPEEVKNYLQMGQMIGILTNT